MRVWIVEVGEPLPIDQGSPRLMRAGLLCEELAAKGHDATWFTSAFNHYQKRMRPRGEFTIAHGDSSYDVVTLAATGYQRHVSPARLRDHRVTAQDLHRNTQRRTSPDVICAGLPTLDLAHASARIAREREVPLVVDVQDLWPDAFVERLPRAARPIAAPLFGWMRHQARAACSAATGLVGLTEPFLDWGLHHADRLRGPLDREIPLAYRRARPTAQESERARQFWTDLGIAFDTPVVTFVGSFSDAFDFDHIAECAREWSVTHPVVRFVLGGAGPSFEAFATSTADLDNVILPGWLDGPDLHYLLANSTVGLAPYRSRPDMMANITNKIIEYLSAGLPVATAMQEGLTADLLRSTGTGVAYDHVAPDGLSDALESIIGSESRRLEMSRAATRVFESRYDAGVVYADYADYLAEVAFTPRVS